MAEQKLDMKITDLEDDIVVGASVNDSLLAVVKHNGVISVLSGMCSHEGGPLAEGHIDNDELICPWHSGAFALDSGKADENTPWATDIKAYKVRVDSSTGEIYIGLEG